MIKISKPPNFKRFMETEQRGLTARLDAVRSAITHAGEKGRALEEDARRIIRSFLPPEYGLGTGFVASTSDDGAVKLSKQLDIIIYDAMRTSPLLSVGVCEVYPIESVYGYVEVKASLTHAKNLRKPTTSSLERCLADNAVLRQERTRLYWSPASGSPAMTRRFPITSLAIRSYVLAFEGKKSFGTLENLAQRVANGCKHFGAHMHGVFVADLGFVYTIPVNVNNTSPEDMYHTAATHNDALLVMKSSMVQALATFPRPPDGCTPAIDRYYNLLPEWVEASPE